MFTRVILAGVVGPLLALLVTWYPAFRVAHNVVDGQIDPAVVEQLRSRPSDRVMSELQSIAVGDVKFNGLTSEVLLQAANSALDGQYILDQSNRELNVPFDPREHEFGISSWHLSISRFLIPSLLARAYEVSGDANFLRAALDYVFEWSKFESSLVVPRGLVLNDHATAARAIVVTELWRQYRNSEIFQADEAIRLLDYVRRTSQLLRDEKLYEYRTNHGMMQNLSLLHLTLAFPLLDHAEEIREVAIGRLLPQMNYFVNGEGVVLEHSPGYQYRGLSRLAAAFRYMGFLGKAVPRKLADRYELALKFNASMLRPDKTLPPIGDTHDVPHAPFLIAEFDDELIVSKPLRPAVDVKSMPMATTVAPAAGFLINWDGLQHWPDATKLGQTVLHWGNFPTGTHKHADELGVSLWSGGVQWVRSVGYWPYDESRAAAIGWRSSNAPHWIGESADVGRSLQLVGLAIEPNLFFVDIRRRNSDDSNVRRQLFQFGSRLWLILDSFEFSTERGAEVIWRFSPEVKLRERAPDYFDITVSKEKPKMSLQLWSSTAKEIDPDMDGNALWNSGVVSNYHVAPSPAIRFAASYHSPVLISIFERTDYEKIVNIPKLAHVDWRGDNSWTITLSSEMRDDRVIERRSGQILIKGVESTTERLQINNFKSEDGSVYRDEALAALHLATRQYGQPFSAQLERRTKVSIAIFVTGIAQMLLFGITCARMPRVWPALFALSSVSWVVLTTFLNFWFLA